MTATCSIEGTWDRRFAAVRTAFENNFARHGEVGAAVAIALDGRLVVDLWGGYADPERRIPWRRDSLANVFSVGKGLTALCALVLAHRRRLDLDAPVCRYWPEFAAGGKEAVSVRDLLSHRAGLPAVRTPLGRDAMLRWNEMTRALADQKPWWPPGTLHGYHVNTFGFLIGEVVRRISGRSLGQFLSEEIAAPLQADIHIGLSAHQESRAAEILWPPEMDPPIGSLPADADDQRRMIWNAYFNPPGLSGHEVVNTSGWRRAEIPSTNAHATARALVRAYAALAAGGTLDGVEIVGRDLLAEAVLEHSNGPDAVLGRASRFGLGFQLPLPERPFGPNPEAFGHFGVGGAVGFADPAAGVAFGYVMNRLGPRWQNPTNRDLVNALYACL